MASPSTPLIVDAVVLAGGRSSRLGGEPKAALVVDGETLLARTLTATADARRTVVVGDSSTGLDALPAGVLIARESPAFGGPAAGIAAGLAALAAADTRSDLVLVLACDMPNVGAAVTALLGAATAEGAVAVDETGRTQQLAGLYPTEALTLAVDQRRDGLDGLAVRHLFAGLNPVPVAVPAGATQDVDTWDDAAAQSVTRAGADIHEEKEQQ